MIGKSGRKIILYKYIWSFSVYIYTHPPDAGVSLNWHKEKRLYILTYLFFSKKNIYISSLLIMTDKISEKLIEFEGLPYLG